MNEKEQYTPSASEHTRKMNELIGNIELSISEWLAVGATPTILIGNHRTFDLIFEHLRLNANEMDWKQPVHIGFAEGAINLRVVRSMDFQTGELKVTL